VRHSALKSSFEATLVSQHVLPAGQALSDHIARYCEAGSRVLERETEAGGGMQRWLVGHSLTSLDRDRARKQKSAMTDTTPIAIIISLLDRPAPFSR
jgi:hypothetical protein